MKVSIIESEESKINTDWDKVQVMRYGTNLILSTGMHSERNFEGINLKSGTFGDSWVKSFYSPVPPGEKIIIEFQND